MDEAKARALAIETRLKLGLHSTEYVDVYKAASSLHITCIKRILESNISGATIKANDTVYMILVNSRKSLGHQNFTVAHELYHCLYDTGMQNRACVVELFSKKPATEQIAELFAVHFLMPEDGIWNQLMIRNKIGENLSVSDVIYLEQFFGVSRKAMCWRLEELGLISKQDGIQFSKDVVQGVKRLGRDIALYELTNENTILSDYAERANEAFEKALITQSRYEEILADAGLLELPQIEDDSQSAE